MAEQDFPSAAVLAETFLNQSHVVWFAEDVYVFDHSSGVYERKSREWLAHVVLLFLKDAVGAQSVEAALVANVCKAIKHSVYLDERRHPPFWIRSGKPARVFVTANGILSVDAIASGAPPEIAPHTPDLFAVCGVPYKFDASAQCPKWLDFVRWMVAGNEGEVRLIQQFCAWVFVAAILKLEKILWLCGPGGNGKSTLLQILRWVFGEAATSAVGLDAFQGAATFRLWPTVHRLANFCLDAVVKRKSDVAGLNAFVSGDCFTINRKFREQLTIEPATVCFFASNPLPLLDDSSDAFWRRLLLIRCDQRLSEDQINPTLIPELKEEASGILNWMLAALPGLMARRRFEIPDSVRRNVELLKAEVNSVRQFIREKIEVGDKSDFLPRDQFMEFYGQWCKLNLVSVESFDVVKQEVRLAFGAELTRLRRGEFRGAGTGRDRVRGWMGIRWQEDEAPPKSVQEWATELVEARFAVREAEMRCHRATDAAEANVKDGAIVRHMETSDGIAANPPSASVEREQESDISTDDIEALMKRLGDDPVIVDCEHVEGK